jgi:hypothetical protein
MIAGSFGAYTAKTARDHGPRRCLRDLMAGRVEHRYDHCE